MKKLSILSAAIALVFVIDTKAQSTDFTGTVNVLAASNETIEGGQLNLRGAGENNDVYLDNFAGDFRVLNGEGGLKMAIEPELTLYPGIFAGGAAESGGRLRLKSEDELDWVIDNYRNNFRIFTDGRERFTINSSGIVQLRGVANSSSEGGQIDLLGVGGNNSLSLDNFNGWLRLHHSGRVWFAVSPKGRVEARGIKVTNSPSADFVFDESYQLPKLTDVEKFIAENHHLPEIQSAKDMEENGVVIEEFQIQLLQKIEELTLYVIEQNKKIKELTTALGKN